MKMIYEMPDIKFIKVASEEIMLLSKNDDTPGEGEEVKWEDWT